MDGQGTPLRVGIETDFQCGIVGKPLRPGKGLETEAVECVGGIGNEFTQEDLFVGIQRVDHQLQELRGFCLKDKRFRITHSHVRLSRGT